MRRTPCSERWAATINRVSFSTARVRLARVRQVTRFRGSLRYEIIRYDIGYIRYI